MGRKKKPVPTDNEFASRIDQFIGDRTNEEVAKETGIGAQTIGYYRQGRIPLTIKLEQFKKLCEILKVSADELLFGKKAISNNGKYIKITYEIIRTDSIRQILFTAETTREEPSNVEKLRKKSTIYIDLP